MAVCAAHIALSDLDQDTLPAAPAVRVRRDIGDFFPAMVELQDDDVADAAINARMRRKIGDEVLAHDGPTGNLLTDETGLLTLAIPRIVRRIRPREA